MGRFKEHPGFRIRNASYHCSSQDTSTKGRYIYSRTMVEQCIKPGWQERNTQIQTQRVLMKVCFQHNAALVNAAGLPQTGKELIDSGTFTYMTSEKNILIS